MQRKLEKQEAEEKASAWESVEAFAIEPNGQANC